MVHSYFIQKQPAVAGLRWFDTSYTSNVLKNMSIIPQFYPDYDTFGAPLTYLGVFYSKIASPSSSIFRCITNHPFGVSPDGKLYVYRFFLLLLLGHSHGATMAARLFPFLFRVVVEVQDSSR